MSQTIPFMRFAKDKKNGIYLTLLVLMTRRCRKMEDDDKQDFQEKSIHKQAQAEEIQLP